MRGPFRFKLFLMSNVFFNRATQFSAARTLLYDGAEYTAALALLSVHSAISWNDAVLTELSGKPVKGEDHMAAARATQRRCAALKLQDEGIKHLVRLIAAKSRVSYGDEEVTVETAQALSKTSERFETWARRTLKGRR